jgi:tetratricopeptide (TPR) repeat protein
VDILNLLAGYYIHKAYNERAPKKKEEFAATSIEYVNKALQVDKGDQRSWVTRGLVRLLQTGEKDKAAVTLALADFEGAIELSEKDGQRPNAAAVLGKIRILFNRGNFAQALVALRNLVENHPLDAGDALAGDEVREEREKEWVWYGVVCRCVCCGVCVMRAWKPCSLLCTPCSTN